MQAAESHQVTWGRGRGTGALKGAAPRNVWSRHTRPSGPEMRSTVSTLRKGTVVKLQQGSSQNGS